MAHYPMLKKLRLEHHYNQKFLANHLGITQAQYSRLETCHRNLDIMHLIKLADLYGLSCEEVLGIQVTASINNKPNQFTAFGLRLLRYA